MICVSIDLIELYMQASYFTNSQSKKPFQTDKTVGSSSGISGESPWHYSPKAHACTPQARDHTCISFVQSINSKGHGDSPRQITLDRKLCWKGLEPGKRKEPFAGKWSEKELLQTAMCALETKRAHM